MADIVIGYVLLGLVLFLFGGGALASLILYLAWGRKVRYPKGKKINFKYNEFEALLIVDDSVKTEGDEFLIGDKRMNKDVLAKMCAMSMEAVDYTAKTFGPQKLKSKNKLKECVFVFLPEEDYYAKMRYAYFTKVKSAGFSHRLEHNMGQKSGPYVCYMKTEFMWLVYTVGSLSIHEYTHCYSSHVSGNWDTNHDLWKYKTEDGKTLQNIAVERIKTKLELDKKLQS